MTEIEGSFFKFKNAYELVRKAKIYLKEGLVIKAIAAYQAAMSEYRQYLVSLKYIEEDITQKIQLLEKAINRLKANSIIPQKEKTEEGEKSAAAPAAPPVGEPAAPNSEREARRVIYQAKKAIDDLTREVKAGLGFSALKQKVEEIYHKFKKELAEIFGQDSETVKVYVRWLDNLINDLQKIILEKKTVEVKEVKETVAKKEIKEKALEKESEPKAEKSKSTVGQGYKILIVDDEPDVITTLEFLLKSEGFAVAKASNGHEGLKKAAAEKPSLIILDIKMPGMSGYEVAQVIKDNKELKQIPIIFLTAVSQVVDATFGIRTETFADRYISKPYDIEQFVKVIKEILKIK